MKRAHSLCFGARWVAPVGPKVRKVHRADKVAENGGVSALCFKRPRAIDLSRASWTIRPEAVTCPRCKKLQEAAA
jgi:hypothetical protein